MLDHPDEQPRADEAGVALYMALPMALLMIGAAWSILGFGDLILLRTHGQEGADSAAYSAAVTHAQGMNFIACLNVAMVALAGTYMAMRYVADTMNLLLGVHRSGSQVREDLDSGRFRAKPLVTLGYQTSDVLSAACTGADAPPYCFDRSDADKSSCATKSATYGNNADGSPRTACDVSLPLSKAFWELVGGPTAADVNRKTMATFEKKVLGEAVDALSELQFVLQRAQPMVASANAILVTDALKLGGVGVGVSHALVVPKKTVFSQGKTRTGLPVEGKPKSRLCGFAGRAPADAALRAPDKVPAPAGVRAGATLAIRGMMRGNAADRYCADRFLRLDSDKSVRPPASALWSSREPTTREWRGPQYVLSKSPGVQNGGEAFQVFGAMTFVPKAALTDNAMAGLAISQRVLRKGPPQDDKAPTKVRSYVAQAEFFLDCGDGEGGGRWMSAECNEGDLGSFKMQWRARLKPIDQGLMSSLLSGRSAGELEEWLEQSKDAMTVGGPGQPPARVVPMELMSALLPNVGTATFYH